MGRLRSGVTPAENFWSKVNKGGDCWEWTASRTGDGYGHAHFGAAILAHRLSWVLTRGAIPPGMKVLHRCDNPPCVRPEHLFLGTQADNARDREAKGRSGSHVGVLNGRAKLTPEQVRAIRERYGRGDGSQRQIAKEYSVSPSLIQRVVRGDLWSHI